MAMAVSTYDAKWDAMTLYQSFDNEVLILTPQPANLYVPNININRKGLSTQQAVPPAIWFPRHVNQYLHRAAQLRTKHQSALSGSYLPAPYIPCALNSESDIVQASVLWLLHPVIKALQAEFPDAVCAAEVTIGDCRCDALISIGRKPIAVIEYKSRGNLTQLDFEQGCIQDPTEANAQNINDALKDVENAEKQSAMAMNATCLTKQAAAYSLKWKTRYVALFDWDSLFLWNFAGTNFEAPLIGRGGAGRPTGASKGVAGHAKWAYGTWVHDRAHYRSALLGFVLEAYNDKRHPTHTRNGALPPWEPSPATKDQRRREAEEKRSKSTTTTTGDAYKDRR